MTDTTTRPYKIVADPDGSAIRWFCELCPAGGVGNDPTLLRRRADDHQVEAHSDRTNSSAGEVLAVATAEIRRLQAVVARVLAECDAIDAAETRPYDHYRAAQQATRRIRTAIEEPTP